MHASGTDNCTTVALRKESVDRNTGLGVLDVWALRSLSARRAWIEILDKGICHDGVRSLSARRAWIEIEKLGQPSSVNSVALRKESVDRNLEAFKDTSLTAKSLSARRAWIEI